jgi:hypothetical protein
MEFFFNYMTRRFMTTREIGEATEELYLARYVMGPRSGRPMYKGDCRYNPETGIFRN